MELFLYLNGERRGPFPEERVRASLEHGFLRPSDLAGERLDGDWKPLSTILESCPESAAPLPSVGASGERHSLGSYVGATIAPDEKPLYKTNVHPIVFARSAGLGLLAFFFLAIPFGLGVQAFTSSHLGWFALPFPMLLLIPPTLVFASSELVITSSRVLIKTGYLHRETREMFVARIESVSVHQSVLGRLLDYGTVTIRGTGGSEETFASIAHPLAFRNAVQGLQDGAAERGG